jgi:hypothetical protein
MGAYEGAAVTVVAKGVNPGPGDYFGVANEATFPTGSTNLTAANCTTGTGGAAIRIRATSNATRRASMALTLTDASEGGGGIFVHAWAHNLQIANNRVYGNIGTLSGGINVGQGESPDAYLQRHDTRHRSRILRVQATSIPNTQEPYCFDLNVNVHNNSVTSNTSIGDELFSGTPAGAGGVSFCTGADYYKFNYNWVCGNMSTGDGGGVAHIGFNKNGDIEHNTIIFNQSLNPTIPTNGGGIIVMATAPDGTLPPNSAARHRMRQRNRRRLRSWVGRRHRSRTGDQRQPDHGQRCRSRQRRRHSLPGSQRHGYSALPDTSRKTGTRFRSPTTSSPTTLLAGMARRIAARRAGRST